MHYQSQRKQAHIFGFLTHLAELKFIQVNLFTQFAIFVQVNFSFCISLPTSPVISLFVSGFHPFP